MKHETPLSKCCSCPISAEDVSLIAKCKTTFAKAPVCSGCSRILGDPKPVYGCGIRPLENPSWGTTWALVLEHRRQRIGAPLYVVEKEGLLVPEATASVTPVQADLPDNEVPF